MAMYDAAMKEKQVRSRSWCMVLVKVKIMAMYDAAMKEKQVRSRSWQCMMLP